MSSKTPPSAQPPKPRPTPTPTPTSSLSTRQTTSFKQPTPKKKLQTTLSTALKPKPPAPSTAPKGWQSDSFSDYMQEKQRKLRLQFSRQFHSSPPPSTLFRNLVAWIDGYTRPSRLQLTRLIASHGGRVETYFSPQKVTHVIADNLAAATRKRLGSLKGIKVTTPAWIVDSIDADARLKEADYAVKGMPGPPSTIFTSRKR